MLTALNMDALRRDYVLSRARGHEAYRPETVTAHGQGQRRSPVGRDRRPQSRAHLRVSNMHAHERWPHLEEGPCLYPLSLCSAPLWKGRPTRHEVLQRETLSPEGCYPCTACRICWLCSLPSRLCAGTVTSSAARPVPLSLARLQDAAQGESQRDTGFSSWTFMLTKACVLFLFSAPALTSEDRWMACVAWTEDAHMDRNFDTTVTLGGPLAAPAPEASSHTATSSTVA